MTYWMTLWYAGVVVLQLGYDGQTIDDCIFISTLAERDIATAYQNQETMEKLKTSIFPTNEFAVSCETTVIPIDEEYKQ